MRSDPERARAMGAAGPEVAGLKALLAEHERDEALQADTAYFQQVPSRRLGEMMALEWTDIDFPKVSLAAKGPLSPS